MPLPTTPVYDVTISHTIETTVQVEAATPEAAAERVNDRTYPLPPRAEWEGMKDWRIVVRDPATGDELHESDR